MLSGVHGAVNIRRSVSRSTASVRTFTNRPISYGSPRYPGCSSWMGACGRRGSAIDSSLEMSPIGRTSLIIVCIIGDRSIGPLGQGRTEKKNVIIAVAYIVIDVSVFYTNMSNNNSGRPNCVAYMVSLRIPVAPTRIKSVQPYRPKAFEYGLRPTHNVGRRPYSSACGIGRRPAGTTGCLS